MKHFQPNLFIPGAAKSGTTTLHELLNIHPEICMSSHKEPAYWISLNLNNLDEVEKEKYSNLFTKKEALIFGESSTSYMYYDNFISNIKANYKISPKFIFILRNPIYRCYSHYWWMVGLGLEKSNFKNAVKSDLNRIFKPYSYYPDYYYQYGLYSKWLTPFYENFDRKNIKIITLESLSSHRIKMINECFIFLGLKKLESIPEIVSNKTFLLKYPRLFHFAKKTIQGKYRYTKFAKYFISEKNIQNIRNKIGSIEFIKKSAELNYPKISSSDRMFLKEHYALDVSKLKEITGMQFKEWEELND